jgi:NitT/TauT family transport system ATP-binding protein
LSNADLSTDQAGIVVKGIDKAFPRRGKGKPDLVRVLEKVSLSVRPSEFVGIVGPSGSGKTTLLRILAGLDFPDAGEVRIDGSRVGGPGPDRAVVFQQHCLLPWADVLTNVALGLKLRGLGKGERLERARELVRLVGLDGFEDALPRHLSGGMQQRVGLARALAVDPRYLLLDEPFGSLDEITRRSMQDELLRIWEQTKKTALFITHSVEEAVYLSDRVLVISRPPRQSLLELPVPLPRPRTRDLETGDAYLAAKTAIWSALDRDNLDAAEAPVAEREGAR